MASSSFAFMVLAAGDSPIFSVESLRPSSITRSRSFALSALLLLLLMLFLLLPLLLLPLLSFFASIFFLVPVRFSIFVEPESS